jgi:hypothetical protein
LRTPAHSDQENFKRMIQQQYQQMFDVTSDNQPTEESPEKIVPENQSASLMNENRQSFNEFAQMKPATQSFKTEKEIQKEQVPFLS